MKKGKYFIILALLFQFSLICLFLKSKTDVIYTKLGTYFFKKNNIEKSQIYFEKAFELGSVDDNSRDIYINSIINSPLSIEAQEKLIKFLSNPIDDSASLKAKIFLNDLKREFGKKYPDNYISNAVYNQKIMRWGSVPITYGFKNIEKFPNYFVKEIENAFWDWENYTNHKISFAYNQENPNILIKLDENNPADSNDSKYVVAYTIPITNLDKLIKMEIKFYLKDSNGKDFSSIQVYNTAMHEIIHALGFIGHSDNKDSLMYLTQDSSYKNNNSKIVPTDSDINTIKLLYDIKPDITNTSNYNAKYISEVAIGKDEEINDIKLEEAKSYVKKAPELSNGYIDLAEGYLNSKDYNNAIKNLKKALLLANTEDMKAMVYYNLAIAYFYSDNLDLARQYLQSSIEINSSEEKHYLLGEIYVREGKFDDAIYEYTCLLEKNPKNIEYVIALTNIYIINHEYFNARKVLKYYYSKNPEDRDNKRFDSYGILKLGL